MILTRKKTIIAVLIVITLILTSIPAYGADNETQLKPYTNAWFGKSADLRGYDFNNAYDLVTTLTYSQKGTKWPSSDKMPAGFSPAKFLEWGKTPGLGVKDLHKQGYTGKGVNIAYIDQPLGSSMHVEYKDLDLHYYLDIMKNYKQSNDESMHGAAVLSIMAGKKVGVAPEASVYYVAEPSWLGDQKTRADAILKLLEENKSLPSNKKIKVIGISNNPDSQKKGYDALLNAVEAAKAQGVYVLFCGEFNIAEAIPFADREDPGNYSAHSWGNVKKIPFQNNNLYIPTDRTTATLKNDYIKWGEGGWSWTSPYAVGLMAIGWQINNDLTAKELLDMMYQSATKSGNVTYGGLINPKAFVQAVEATVKSKRDYKVFIYNSSKTTSADMVAIKTHEDKVSPKEDVLYVDVSGVSSAGQVYDKIKILSNSRDGKITGIQIFGTDQDVPAFKLQFKVEMFNGKIDNGGTYLSDYFYGNLGNDKEEFENISAYSIAEKKEEIELTLQWPVVRLPLTKGEYEVYFAKYDDYNRQVKKTKSIPLVNFSNPIFRSKIHMDDMSWFIKNRIDEEFHILNSSQYKIFGNLEGMYPVTTKVSGDFSTENLKKTNNVGISDILINSHGQKNNIDKAIYVDNKEKRISTLNSENINTVLGENYYNLMTWTCNNAEALDTDNLAYNALRGKAVNVFATTTGLSNNGVNNKASLANLRRNNFYYFYYSFMKYYYGGLNRSDSFWLAKRDYVNAILANSETLTGEGNYQFNLNNALSYQHLGVLSFAEPVMGTYIAVPDSGKLSGSIVLAPMKSVMETLGFDVKWNNKKKELLAVNSGTKKTVKLTSDKKTAYVNNKKISLSSTPKTIKGKVYLSIKSIKSLTGCDVKWKKTEKTVELSDKSKNGYILTYQFKVKK